MANKRFWLGILVMMLVFGMTAFSCGADQGGSFTITNISSRFDGKFVVLEGKGMSSKIIGAQSLDPSDWSGTGARISNGKVEIPLWLDERNSKVSRYAGSHTFEKIEIDISNVESLELGDWIASLEYESITFSNGKATVSFQDADYFNEY